MALYDIIQWIFIGLATVALFYFSALVLKYIKLFGKKADFYSLMTFIFLVCFISSKIILRGFSLAFIEFVEDMDYLTYNKIYTN